MSFEEISKLKNNNIRLGIVVYGKLKMMYIEKDIFLEKQVDLENENGDRVKVVKNIYGNTEIYTDKAVDITTDTARLKASGIDELRLDFTDESPDEIRKIIKKVKANLGEYNPYNYEKGVF
jgi:putative protease